MNHSLRMVRSLLCDESGQDLIEYALIATLVCLVAITGLTDLSGKISSRYTAIGNGM
ncbi:MAG TPA: Flp family type IVb pilin [Acidobacteriaceae bacterium]|nr:Flp family type IVb pilin [Acidobacteriaceae bacterium]